LLLHWGVSRRRGTLLLLLLLLLLVPLRWRREATATLWRTGLHVSNLQYVDLLIEKSSGSED